MKKDAISKIDEAIEKLKTPTEIKDKDDPNHVIHIDRLNNTKKLDIVSEDAIDKSSDTKKIEKISDIDTTATTVSEDTIENPVITDVNDFNDVVELLDDDDNDTKDNDKVENKKEEKIEEKPEEKKGNKKDDIVIVDSVDDNKKIDVKTDEDSNKIVDDNPIKYVNKFILISFCLMAIIDFCLLIYIIFFMK